MIFIRKNNSLSPSVYCPDTSKRVPQIVTATETGWRNRFVRDWKQTKRAKNHDTLRDLLRWGWAFFERTQILSGIQFTTHFIEIFVVETKRFVGSFVNVILTRQTCGQRSSRAAESKRRALGNYFSERICYMFLISKCRGDWDLGLCTTSVLAFGEPQRNGKIRFFLRRNTFFFRKSPLRCGFWNASTDVVHRPRSQSPLHFDIRNI